MAIRRSPARKTANLPPTRADLIDGVRQLLVPHFRDNFTQYKKSLGAQKGSVKWSAEAQNLVLKDYPFVEKEYRFHTKCDSAFDLYSPDFDLVFELAMFQGNAIYEFHKVLFKLLIAGPTYSHLVFCMPSEPGLAQLRRPFNRLSFDVFERTQNLEISWMALDIGSEGWVGPLDQFLKQGKRG